MSAAAFAGLAEAVTALPETVAHHPRRIYVGATFTRYEEVRTIIDALTEVGHHVTFDWTRTNAFGADGHPRPESNGGYDLPSAEQREHAIDDMIAVSRAEILLMLGQEASCGWLVETGMALALGGKQVWIVAPFKETVFWHLPQVTIYDDVNNALAELGAGPVAT